MASSVIFEERVEIPYCRSLAEFRAWALSDDFPERSRIDYIAGRIEVDMSPENVFFHGSVKTEVVRVLSQRRSSAGGGYLFSDCTRVSSPDADLSAEPDVVYLSAASLDSGRVRLVPSAGGEPDSYVELEGAGPGRGDRQRQFRCQGHEALADFLFAPGLRSTGWSMCGGSDWSSAFTPAAGGYEPAPVDDDVSSFRRSSTFASVSNVAATPAAAGSSTSSRGPANLMPHRVRDAR